jgi:hypothetical protein
MDLNVEYALSRDNTPKSILIMMNWYKTNINCIMPKTSEVNNQKSHVDADVREMRSEMTNGQQRMINGVKGRYFQKRSLSVVDAGNVGNVGKDGISTFSNHDENEEHEFMNWFIVSFLFRWFLINFALLVLLLTD